MWKSAVGHNVSVKVEAAGDDWDTDPDFVNDISEQEQRWGAKTIEGSGRPQHIDIHELRNKVSEEHDVLKKKELQEGPKASYGYGGKFGTERDRMDKSALGHDYTANVEKHSSQTDAAKGFGGKYGVQKDRTDKSAVGFEYKGEVKKHASQQDYSKGFGGRYGVEKDKVDKAAVGFDYKGVTEKHESQTDYAVGFGGKYGVQKDRQDKAALGWDHQEAVKPHESQTDHAVGFGGKFGVQKDRQDKSALNWDHKEEVKPHESQTDHAKGFGGRYGVQKDRVDKSAAGFNQMEAPTSSYEKTNPVEAASSGASSLKARFENMAKSADDENKKRAEEERARRQAREKQEREQAQKQKVEETAEEPEEEPSPRASVPLPAIKSRISKELPKPPVVVESEPVRPHEDEAEYEEPPGLPPRPSDQDDDYEDCEVIQREAPPPLPDKVDVEDDYENMPVVDDPVYDLGHTPEVDYEEMPGLPPARVGDAKAPQGGDIEEENIYEGTDGGLSAVAIYDYEGEGDDEISFDPKDVITNIEMVDEGWWRGFCNGKFGLFPANYVQLIQ
ncbi:src substrate cortactin-like [Pleurodeles waltl]